MRRLYIIALLHGAIIGGLLMEAYREYHPVTVTETVTAYKIKWYQIDPDNKHYMMDVSGDYDTDIDTMIEWEGVRDL